MILVSFLLIGLLAVEGLSNFSEQSGDLGEPIDFGVQDDSRDLESLGVKKLIGGAMSRSKKSFHGLKCRGNFHKQAFSALNRVCEDCYSLFKIPEMYSMCRLDCFKSEYFVGCLEDLQLRDKRKFFEEMISIVG